MAFKNWLQEYQRPLLGFASVAAVILFWEITLTFLIPLNPFFFTKPSLIAVAFKEQVIDGALWGDLAVSSRAFLWGWSFAVILGIPIGALMGWRRRAEYTLDPFLTALYASPLVALAPLIIVVFGVGLFAKTVLVFVLSIFPFIFNTFAGVKSTDRVLINVVRSFGGKEKDLYFKVIFPSTLPYIVAGARIAIGRGLVGIIVGEFYAASEGIGFAISRFGDTYRLPEMFAGIFVLMIAAVVLTEGMRKFEAVIAPWRKTGET
ncbi:MAG: ABC transporter permease [Deltaproteobacteria bacterium]|nr:ABC transporter permease [Deltaproteobacteria bacterium]MDZ4346966.1 ABC transporter permease [Candidatus Binatia bacterium]